MNDEDKLSVLNTFTMTSKIFELINKILKVISNEE